MWLIAKLIIKIRTQPVHRDYVQSLKICKGTTTACRGTGMSLLQNFPVEFFHFYLSFFKVILRNNKWPHTIKWWIDSTWEHWECARPWSIYQSEAPVCGDYLLPHLHWSSTTNLLEDDAVADGGQQIVEVELIFAVAQIPAMLLSEFHQSFTKPGG